MTWSDPESRDTGDLITAAIWNQDVVANTQWLHDNMAGKVGAYVYNSSNIAIVGQYPVTLTFDSELFDTDGIHDTVSNTDRLIVPEDGLYLVGGCASFGVANYFATLRIASNTLSTLAWTSGGSNGAANCPVINQVTALANLQAGDYLTLWVSQSTTSSKNVAAYGYYSPSFWMVKIGAYIS